ncbi:MAG: ABC transporter ATP-binding protein [Candidatus Thermoplasmatota archaeon]|nr:ABC transporter ATP-binding protein [Candidatus Thermoplasmatota archaeon]
MEKKIKCIKCGQIITISGNPGETITVTCPSCHTSGKFTFEKTKSSTLEETIVKINNISKKYKDILALNNVSFDIKKGEIFGYIGPNGAGKTTTIKILVGLINKTSGHVFINNYEMPEQKSQAHKFIGYLPQKVAFQQWRTLNHALTTFGKLSGMEKNSIQPRINELLEIMELTKFKNKKINQLSGGTIQKVGIIQAILHNPSLIILDEPLEGLDPESRYQVKQIFKDLSKKGTTVFFSSHILSDVEDVATKICILDWGRVIKIGTLDELKTEFVKEKQIEIILSKKSNKFKEISKLPGVQNILEKSYEKFLINIDKTDNYDEVIHNIIQTLLKNECHIRSITPIIPTLDEVYQYYLRKGDKKQ